MERTPFPTTPMDVVVLTAQEFTFELDIREQPALDDVCGRFGDDADRALVWVLRFRALKALCMQPDMTDWLATRAHAWRTICAVAAGFELNEAWAFDRITFCSAVDQHSQYAGDPPSAAA